MSKKIVLVIFFTLTASLIMGKETGGASWYGGKFQGRLTANGEIFDTNTFTAAHKTLPFNTIVEVTNMGNNKSVLVRINDRGPFVEGRIIDLSRAAADQIGLVGKGVGRVVIKIIKDIEDLQKNGTMKMYKGLIPPGKTVSDRANIQVASFSNRENAEKVKTILHNHNFSPELEFTSTGYIRILLTDIPNTEVEEVTWKLRGLGFSSVLIRKKLAARNK